MNEIINNDQDKNKREDFNAFIVEESARAKKNVSNLNELEKIKRTIIA